MKYNQMPDAEWQHCLTAITNHLVSSGVVLKYNSNSFKYCAEDSTITCNQRIYGTYKYICSLLHEVGHVHQMNSRFRTLPASKRRNQAIIIELEYTAWQIGEQIAQELDLFTPELQYTYTELWAEYWTEYIRVIPSYTQPVLNTLITAYDVSCRP